MRRAIFLLSAWLVFISTANSQGQQQKRRTPAAPPLAAARTVEIFGTTFTTTKLGIIIDCSGSTHAFLLQAFREFGQKAGTEPMVLTMGCGIRAARDVQVELYGSLIPDKERDKIGTRTILGQLAGAKEKYTDMEKYLLELKKRDNVWAVYGGDIGATGYAFEKLIEMGVDTIYWFADFQDPVDPAIMDALIVRLKLKGIKVIAHNFSGGFSPYLPERMAIQTGGLIISQKPK